MLSNDIAALTPGRGCLSSLMDVKGRLLCFFRVLLTPDAVLLEMPADRLEFVTRTLEHYRVAAPVRFGALEVSVLGLVGPRAPDILRDLGVADVPTELEGHVVANLAGHAARVARAGDLPADGYVLHVPRAGTDDVTGALTASGAPSLSSSVLDVLRVEDGRAWYGPDVTDDNLLFETGLLREYHVPKGCYVGQEVVARLEARGGHVNKQLRGLALTEPAAVGAVVSADGQDVGRVTTAGVSPRLGAIAMAYVHRRHFEPGTPVEVEGQPATVVALPFASRETR